MNMGLRWTKALAFGLAAFVGARDGWSAPIDVVIAGVKPIKQVKKNGCWATTATMVRNWSFEQSGLPGVGIEQTITAGAPALLDVYQRDQRGSDPKEEKAFYEKLGFIVLQQLNPSIAAWAEMLEKRGPLSVTISANALGGTFHGVVVTGMKGDGTPDGTLVHLIDPADGKVHTMSFKEYVRYYEGAVGYALQIAHLPKK